MTIADFYLRTDKNKYSFVELDVENTLEYLMAQGKYIENADDKKYILSMPIQYHVFLTFHFYLKNSNKEIIINTDLFEII